MSRQTSYRFENGQSAFLNTQTTDYTLTPEDNGKIVIITSAAAKNLTIPTLLPVGFNCIIVQGGAGQVTFIPSGTTVSNVSSHTKTSAVNAQVGIISIAPDVFVFAGGTA